MRDRDDGELVWLPYERVFGRIVGPVGAHYTKVSYTYMGIDYDEVLLENDDFVMMEDWSFDDNDD